jgi:hypothetical protein
MKWHVQPLKELKRGNHLEKIWKISHEKKDKEIVNVSSEGEHEDAISDIQVFSLNIYSGIKKSENIFIN